MKYSVFAVLTGLLLILSGVALMAQDIIPEGAEPEQITEGHQFTEGPYWHPDGFLLYSDIPANQIYKWTPGGEKEVFLEPSGNSNGIIGDGSDGIIIAQHAGQVAHVSLDGELTILIESYDDKRLNSPNDLALTTSGFIYFTDPPYGVNEEDRELDFSGVYRIRSRGGLPQLLFDEFNRPNGIIFSPDESRFYVNDTETGQIFSFDVNEDGSVSEGAYFAEVGTPTNMGAADGMAVDENGNLYSTGPDGVHIFNPEGSKIGMIPTPVSVTNLDWGGDDKNLLYMTAAEGVYVITLNVTGWK